MKRRSQNSHVVPLPGLEPLPLVLHRVKRRARRIQDAPIRALNRLLERALGLGDRVAERKDDRPLVILRHQVQDCSCSKSVEYGCGVVSEV